MVLLLGLAVFLNARYSGSLKDNNVKYMGETAYVSSDVSEDNAVSTSASVSADYFSEALKKREDAYKTAEEEIAETIKNTELSEEAKASAVNMQALLAKRRTDEAEIESVLKAKGFEEVLCFIGDDSVTVTVKKDGLLSDETLQIQDAVTGQCMAELSKIKIVTING